MKKIAVIMRGLPGTGKTTIAHLLAGTQGRVHSTDDYFMVNGVYVFDERYQREYHDRNFRDFCISLDANVPVVVCDNTNVRHWNYERYISAARSAGYEVHIVCMPHVPTALAAVRSRHGVSAHHIELMRRGWQD